MSWQPIESAPKDGQKVFIYSAEWGCAPVASWGEYPANPVLNSENEEVDMSGWLLEDEWIGIGNEEGFLGWDCDPMPTHWAPLPALPDSGPEKP